MESNVWFDQCMDFLARMIEKYGDAVDFPDERNVPTMKSPPPEPNTV